MTQTQNHNRDFKAIEAKYARRSRVSAALSEVKVRYWFLLLTVIVTATLLPEQNLQSINAKQQISNEAATEHSNTESLIPTSAGLASNNDFIEDIKSAKSNELPLIPDVLADTGTGISFTPLLKKSPELWTSTKVKKGDTLYIILKRLGLNRAAATLIARTDNSDPLVRLIPGKTLHIFSKDGKIGDEYIYENTPLTWVYAKRNESSYDIVSHKLPTTTHIRKVKGEIISSLYAAGKVAGISDTLTMNMTEIFGWDIDFAINVQPGDRFKLIFEDVYVNGTKRSHGDIIAAEFINNGKTFRAIANREDDGAIQYYSPEGKSMQKTFLRTPVKFSRISSGFTKARYHPVLKRTRAHKGVDYAASRGTPIRATAAGRVIHAGRKGGYGNAIIISHGSTYSTLYAHLSSYSRGIAKGSKIKQGQTIGRVGSTGLASGPHLHYEFRINGKHVNPLTFNQPASEPIKQAKKADFERSAHYWEEQLDNIDGLTVANNQNSSGS
jgi:murein DD-endopeptidase MepM/ murein hydrolase activator NlpD